MKHLYFILVFIWAVIINLIAVESGNAGLIEALMMSLLIGCFGAFVWVVVKHGH